MTKIPTDEEMTKVVEAIESPLSNDEAIAKVVEITGWSGRQAAEWVLVARTGYYDEILDDLSRSHPTLTR